MSFVHNLFSAKTTCHGQPDPFFDSAFLSLGSIMINDSLQPFLPNLTDGTVRQDGGVFDGDATLIVKPVHRPSLDRFAIQAPFIHSDVKWMKMMVGLGSYIVKSF